MKSLKSRLKSIEIIIFVFILSMTTTFARDYEAGVSFFGLDSPFTDDINNGYSANVYFDMFVSESENIKFRTSAGAFFSDINRTPEKISYGNLNIYRADIFLLYMPVSMLHIGAGAGLRAYGHVLDRSLKEYYARSGMAATEELAVSEAYSLLAGLNISFGSAGLFLDFLYSRAEPELTAIVKDELTNLKRTERTKMLMNILSVQMGLYIQF